MFRRQLTAAPLALALVAGLPLAAATAPEALAQAAPSRPRNVTEATVDITAAIAAARAAGYSAIRSAEWEDGRWEVKGTDAQGRRVELRVDAVTGAVTRDR
jgi:hypothetical protein